MTTETDRADPARYAHAAEVLLPFAPFHLWTVDCDCEGGPHLGAHVPLKHQEEAEAALEAAGFYLMGGGPEECDGEVNYMWDVGW